jgi:release factor glutamine methyltransferase
MNFITIETQQLVQSITQKLSAYYKHKESAVRAAYFLIEKLSEKTWSQIAIEKNLTFSEDQLNLLTSWLMSMTNDHMPLEYILGSTSFLQLTISIKPPILIPRPETEEWCAQFINNLTYYHTTMLTLLDLCTGSGCIALSLAKALPHSTIHAIDISKDALNLAHLNKEINNITNAFFMQSDLYTQLNPMLRYDCIVANPPYIAPEEWSELEPSVTQWEDRNALVAEKHGLDIIERIVAQAPSFLFSQTVIPQLWIEIGNKQGRTVQQLFRERGFDPVYILQDAQQQDRVVIGFWQPGYMDNTIK